MLNFEKIKRYFLNNLLINKKNIISLLIIIIFVLLGNFVYVSGFRNSNPALQHANISYESSGKILKGTDTIDPNNGFTSQTLGNYSAKQILDGKIPLWNHYEGVGSPLAGEMQAASMFPVTIVMILSSGTLIFHIILEILAGFFTYLFLLRLGIGRKAALLGGLIFSLNGTFAWLTNAVFNPIAFLPMLAYGIEVARSSALENKKNGWIVIAIALALSLYSGFPETAFLNGLFIVMWFFVRLYSIKKSVRLYYIKKIALGTIIGLMLSAPILIAFASYLTEAYIGAHNGEFAKISLGIISLPAQILPYIYGSLHAYSVYDSTGSLGGHWGSIGGYFAFSLFIFAIIGIFSKFSKLIKISLILWIIMSMLKMFGVDFVELLWNLIPTVKNAAFYRYIVPSISFALTILAAFGLHEIIYRKITKKTIVGSLIIILICLIAVVYIAYNEIPKINTAPYYKLPALASVLWAVSILVAIYVSIISIKNKHLYYYIVAILSVDILVMFIVPQLATPKSNIDKNSVQYLKENIDYNRFYTLGPIAPNYGTYFEISSINQNDLPVPSRWSNYLTKNLDTNTDPILFVGYFRNNPKGPTALEEFKRNINNYKYVGVKYLVTYPNQISSAELTEIGLKRVFSDKVSDVYEISGAEPYFTSDENCKIVSFTSRDSLRVNCTSDGSLLRRELWMKGWEANVNGNNISINIDRDLFQKINLSKGQNEITFKFAPKYINIGYFLFIIAFAIIIYFYTYKPYKSYISK